MERYSYIKNKNLIFLKKILISIIILSWKVYNFIFFK